MLINPPGSEIGRDHTILWGSARRYHVHEFPGPLSVKSVVTGAARWSVGRDRFAIDQRSFVVLNEGQPYSLTIDSPTPVETFIVFFQRGFAREVVRALTTADTALLDAPVGHGAPPTFRQHVYARRPSLLARLAALRGALRQTAPDALVLDAHITGLARQLVELEDDVAHEASRVPAMRKPVRDELYRRLRRGIDFIEGGLGDQLGLHVVARAACVSPYHFHRSFTRVFGETVHTYIRRRRIERACDLLATTTRPIAEIGLDVGFASLGSFSTLFRAQVGTTPRGYRLTKSKNREDA